MSQSLKQSIAKLWGQQLSLLIIITASFWVADLPVTAKSVLLGGLLHWIPNAYFTLYAFRFRGAQAATDVLRSMYRGECGKFVLTALGFALIFTHVKPLDYLMLMLSYTVSALLQLLAIANRKL